MPGLLIDTEGRECCCPPGACPGVENCFIGDAFCPDTMLVTVQDLTMTYIEPAPPGGNWTEVCDVGEWVVDGVYEVSKWQVLSPACIDQGRAPCQWLSVMDELNPATCLGWQVNNLVYCTPVIKLTCLQSQPLYTGWYIEIFIRVSYHLSAPPGVRQLTLYWLPDAAGDCPTLGSYDGPHQFFATAGTWAYTQGTVSVSLIP